jgi:ubiquinone/menaquinone biosynthesis C-methylase UbiE
MENKYLVWKTPHLVKNFLSGNRVAFPGALDQIAVMLKLVEGNSSQVNHFLDIGCGDGILGAAILEKYPQARGVFLDFSEDMLKAAEEKLRNDKDRVELINLDYGDRNWVHKVERLGPFQVIVSGFSIHHQPDERKKELYKEIFNLLTTGGIFINVEHVLSKTEWIGKVHNEYFIDFLFEYEKSQGSGKTRAEISAGFYRRIDKDANILTLVEDQCNWLKDIGFKDVDCYFKVFELAVFGGRK